MDIKSLLADLSNYNVAKFKGYGVEIQFFQDKTPKILPNIIQEDTKSLKEEATPNNDHPNFEGMSQGLEGEMNFDKVLHWSTESDSNYQPTPLTGEE